MKLSKEQKREQAKPKKQYDNLTKFYNNLVGIPVDSKEAMQPHRKTNRRKSSIMFKD